MKIESEEVVLKLDKLFENSIGVEIPYYIRRKKTGMEIVWYGLETNWNFFNNKWHILKKANGKKVLNLYMKLYTKN